MTETLQDIVLAPQILSAEAFAPFGQVIAPGEDGIPFGPDDAQLEFRGTPRFYILSLTHKPLQFRAITRHVSVTQCLGAVDGVAWLIAVAPPDAPDDPTAEPDPARITAFLVPGNRAVKLHRGTWHAGPYFSVPQAAFYNLELADTNQIDHQNCALDRRFGVVFRFGAPP